MPMIVPGRVMRASDLSLPMKGRENAF